jgi:hypothetical protein
MHALSHSFRLTHISRVVFGRASMIFPPLSCRLSSSSTGTGSSDSSSSNNKSPSRRRKRHDFGKIPTLHDFLQQSQVRSLFRQYLRTIRGLSQKQELLKEIRHEFEKDALGSWEMKRNLSEGSRRLKDLSVMLQTSVVSHWRFLPNLVPRERHT